MPAPSASAYLDAPDAPSASAYLDAPDEKPSASAYLDAPDVAAPKLPDIDIRDYLKGADPNALSPFVGETASLDNPTIKTAQDIKEAYTLPLVTLPKPRGPGTAAQLVRGTENVAESLTSPMNIALLASVAGAPAVLQKAASIGFGAKMIKDLPQQVMDVGDAPPGQKVEKGTEAALTAAMALLAAKHGLSAPEVDSALKATAAAKETPSAEPASTTERTPVAAPVPPAGTPAGRDVADTSQTDITAPKDQASAIAPKTAKAVEEAGAKTEATPEAEKAAEPVKDWTSATSEDVTPETAGMRRGTGEGSAVNPQIIQDAAQAVMKIPGAEGYVDGWKSRVSGFFKQVGAIKRFVESAEQRDKIAALYDSAETQAGYVADQAKSHVKLGTNEMDRQAATFVQQANGDRAGMTAKLEALRGNDYKVGKVDLNKVIDHTLSNWDRLQKVADRAKTMTDTAHDAAKASGINLEYRERYAKGAYEEFDPHNRKVVFDAQKGGGGASGSFTKPKVFNDYAEAIAAGYKPKTLDIADLTQSAVLNTMKEVNRRAWVSALGEIKMPDGKPVISDLEKMTSERPGKESVDDSGNVAADSKIQSHGLKAPDGYRLLQIEPGSMVAVHEEAFPLIEKLTDTSHFPMVLAQLAGGVKHNILAFDIYHGSRFAQMQAAFTRAVPSYRKGLATLEYADRDLTTAVNSGEITPEQAAYAKEKRPILEGGISQGLNVGKISDALFKDVAPLFPGAKTTTNFIFGKLSRGIIAESYVHAFDRNAKMHPELTDDALHRYTAKEVNQYFRNLGNQGIFKSKTWQDTSRFMMLAPQWFEGRVVSEARGYGQLAKAPVTGKIGNIGAAMGTGLVGYFALLQVVNMLTRGTPTWENPEPGHKLDAWIPDPAGSTGNFISPDSIFAETEHDIRKMHDAGQSALNIPGEVAKGTIGPIPRSLWDLSTGHDFFGQPLHGLDRFTQAAKDVAPIPLSLKKQDQPGSGERQALSFTGLKATSAGSYSANTYKLAQNWLSDNGLKRPGAQEGEQGPASIYAPLRQALEMNDPKKAARELTNLRKTVKDDLIDKHFGSLDSVRFTGRKSTEDDFINSLKPREKAIYDKAITKRQAVMNRYDALVEKNPRADTSP